MATKMLLQVLSFVALGPLVAANVIRQESQTQAAISRVASGTVTQNLASATSAPSNLFPTGASQPLPPDFDVSNSFFPNITLEEGDLPDNLPPSNNTNDEVVAQGNWLGTRLIKYDKCSVDQQRQINDAYYDQWKLTNRNGIMKNIDWNSAAALEFLGPPANNKDSQARISDLFDHAASVIYSYKNPFQHLIHVRCDDPMKECQTTCNAEVQTGHTIAYSSQRDPNDGYSMINFCPPFFKMRRLRDDALNYGKGRPPPLNNWLRTYDNTARVFLHELFHLDYFMSSDGSNHVSDLTIAYKTSENGDSLAAKAYGPEYTKILARFQEDSSPPSNMNAGFYVARNADNLAWFAMALYVQQRTGTYPHLPIITKKIDGPPYRTAGGLTTFGSNEDPAFNFTAAGDINAYNGTNLLADSSKIFSPTGVKDGIPEDPSCSDDLMTTGQAVESNNGAAPGLTLNVSGMADDTLYPPEYLADVATWMKADFDIKSSDNSA